MATYPEYKEVTRRMLLLNECAVICAHSPGQYRSYMRLDISIRSFDVAALYARMTILLRKTALEMDFRDQKTGAICDAVI